MLNFKLQLRRNSFFLYRNKDNLNFLPHSWLQDPLIGLHSEPFLILKLGRCLGGLLLDYEAPFTLDLLDVFETYKCSCYVSDCDLTEVNEFCGKGHVWDGVVRSQVEVVGQPSLYVEGDHSLIVP